MRPARSHGERLYLIHWYLDNIYKGFTNTTHFSYEVNERTSVWPVEGLCQAEMTVLKLSLTTPGPIEELMEMVDDDEFDDRRPSEDL